MSMTNNNKSILKLSGWNLKENLDLNSYTPFAQLVKPLTLDRVYPETDFTNNNIDYSTATVVLSANDTFVNLKTEVPQMLSLCKITLVLPKAITIESWLRRIIEMTVTIGGNIVSIPMGLLHAFIAARPKMVYSDDINNYVEITTDFNCSPIGLACYFECSINYKYSAPEGLSLGAKIIYVNNDIVNKICDGIYDMNWLTSFNNKIIMGTCSDTITKTVEKMGARQYITPGENVRYNIETNVSLRPRIALVSKIFEIIVYDSIDYSDFIVGSSVDIYDGIQNSNINVPVSRYSACGKTYYGIKLSEIDSDNMSYDVVTAKDQHLVFDTVRSGIPICIITISAQINTVYQGLFVGKYSSSV